MYGLRMDIARTCVVVMVDHGTRRCDATVIGPQRVNYLGDMRARRGGWYFNNKGGGYRVDPLINPSRLITERGVCARTREPCPKNRPPMVPERWCVAREWYLILMGRGRSHVQEYDPRPCGRGDIIVPNLS